MIRKLHPKQPNDRSDFQNWATAIPQTEFFNWTSKSLTESFDQDICWGLWDQNTLHSVVCFLNPSEPLEVLWLATRPESEKRGYMKTLLLEAINNTTRQVGRPEVPDGRQILLEVHEKNLKAIKLYYSLGFIEFGRRKNYYKDGANALLLTLKVQ